MSLVAQIRAMLASGMSIEDSLAEARYIEDNRILKRKVYVGNGVGYVPLSQGKVGLIDAADVPLVEGRNWSALLGHVCWYAVGANRDADGKRIGNIPLHRLIMGPSPGLVIDHISGDGLDNRRANLRFATTAENIRNSRTHRRSVSGLKGACRKKQGGRWFSQIGVNGRTLFLGSFDTAEQAHEAYCAAARKYFGEFARFK